MKILSLVKNIFSIKKVNNEVYTVKTPDLILFKLPVFSDKEADLLQAAIQNVNINVQDLSVNYEGQMKVVSFNVKLRAKVANRFLRDLDYRQIYMNEVIVKVLKAAVKNAEKSNDQVLIRKAASNWRKQQVHFNRVQKVLSYKAA